jgi:putative peptidoglycan lipid II flippase
MATVGSSLARNVATVGTATLLSRLLGFVRDLGIAAVLGAGVASDAFFAAMLIPNLFRRLLSEGALNPAFVPTWMRLRAGGEPDAPRRFAEEAFGMVMAVLGYAALICTLLAPLLVHLVAPGFGVAAGDHRFGLAITYFRIALPYVTIAGLVAVAAATLNAEGRVGAVSFGLVIYNGVTIAAVGFVAFGAPAFDPGIILSAAVVLAGLAQLLIIGTALLRLPDPPIHPRLVPSPDTRHFFVMALPGIIAAGIPQFKLMAGAMIASSSQSAVSWLYYTYRLYELPLGVISVTIASVMAPLIAASVRADKDQTSAAQSRAVEIALGVALPAAVGLAVLSQPIAASLFQHGAFGAHDTEAVAAAMAAIAAGLPGHALEKVFGSIAFAHEDTRTPMLAALAGLAAAVAAALALFPIYGHVGIAAAIAGSGWVGAATLGIVLAHRRWLALDPAVATRLPRIVLIALAMGLVIFLARMLLGLTLGALTAFLPRIVELAALVCLGLIVYIVGLHRLGVARVRAMVAAMRAGASKTDPM